MIAVFFKGVKIHLGEIPLKWCIFRHEKKMILNNNNVIDFDPIKIQTCLAPHNDRQHLLFVKDIYVDAKKMTTNGLKMAIFET